MLDLIHKKIYNIFVKPFLTYYLRKERWFNYKNLRLKIYAGVFHPAHFFSTSVFSDYINTLDLKDKKLCEVGAGSGLLSFIAYTKGAHVVSFDISELAVNGINENLVSNFKQTSQFVCYQSNLFDAIPENKFDVLLINPPYFFSNPKSISDYSWYCGKNGEYFEKLFTQLPDYSSSTSSILMILAENCEIEKIKSIAKKHSYVLQLMVEKKIKWEKNFIFKLVKHP